MGLFIIIFREILIYRGESEEPKKGRRTLSERCNNEPNCGGKGDSGKGHRYAIADKKGSTAFPPGCEGGRGEGGGGEGV